MRLCAVVLDIPASYTAAILGKTYNAVPASEASGLTVLLIRISTDILLILYFTRADAARQMMQEERRLTVSPDEDPEWSPVALQRRT